MTDEVHPEGTQRLMFDAAIVELLRPALADVFLKHGDTVRSIGVFIDYHGELNDANINKGLWMGAEGSVTSPAGIIGSANVCTRLLEVIVQRAQSLQTNLQEQLQVLLTEINQGHQTLEEQKAKQGGPDSPGPGGATGPGNPST